jgi:hypothetical protein
MQIFAHLLNCLPCEEVPPDIREIASSTEAALKTEDPESWTLEKCASKMLQFIYIERALLDGLLNSPAFQLMSRQLRQKLAEHLCNIRGLYLERWRSAAWSSGLNLGSVMLLHSGRSTPDMALSLLKWMTMATCVSRLHEAMQHQGIELDFTNQFCKLGQPSVEEQLGDANKIIERTVNLEKVNRFLCVALDQNSPPQIQNELNPNLWDEDRAHTRIMAKPMKYIEGLDNEYCRQTCSVMLWDRVTDGIERNCRTRSQQTMEEIFERVTEVLVALAEAYVGSAARHPTASECQNALFGKIMRIAIETAGRRPRPQPERSRDPGISDSPAM